MSAWKACDLRGRYPDEVSAGLFYEVGARLIRSNGGSRRVLIAGDFRASTPQLKEALRDGLLASGADVIDAGQIPTPVAYFAAARLKTDAVSIVTGSHNPVDHNGLKFMIGRLPPSELEIKELQQRLLTPPDQLRTGTCERVEPVASYESWLLERWKGLRANRLSVVLDAGGGAWSVIAPAVFERLGVRVTRLFCEIDPGFRFRPPDSARAENLERLAAVTREERADLGIAWDGDGDRVAFVDETGRIAWADQTSILLARHILGGNSGERIVYDIKLSDVVRQAISQCGAAALVERSGHTFLKRRMVMEDCIFGCEASGHYFHRELGGGDDGLFTALMMAGLVAARGPLSRMLGELPPMYLTPEIRLPASLIGYDELVERLQAVLPEARQVTVDGVRFELNHGCILVRPSVTEAVVTLRVEGTDRGGLNALVAAAQQALPDCAGMFEGDFRSRRS